MSPTPRAVSHFGLAALEARAAPTQPVAPAWPQRPERRTVVRLWLPMTVIFLLLAPFAVLAIPFLYLAPPLRRMNCAAAVFVLGRMLLSLGGTVVEVETPGALVRIRIF